MKLFLIETPKLQYPKPAAKIGFMMLLVIVRLVLLAQKCPLITNSFPLPYPFKKRYAQHPSFPSPTSVTWQGASP
jgi:hypothetical protein